ncbi:NAD(P)/FAD-dependent oxidoreductase [Portibacter marinus]|uniref:NAD(P)/FAD-dependent oxidoreductase n=1 Tax=Portibacter marinus TaxID=2898660 RepID=UPI001F271644|nr:FAD-dependent monooxygenase [Portibacter marinus]
MKTNYDLGIIGGGLAGLTLAIQLSINGQHVILFEKNEFPFHKLCGEYLSNESIPFLEYLGLDVTSLQPAKINRLELTNASGKNLTSDLPLGGIGLSRWTLDHKLYDLAKSQGVTMKEGTFVKSYSGSPGAFEIKTSEEVITCDHLVSCFGKKSNLKGINQSGVEHKNEYVGVKYHVRYPNQPADLVSLHNFKEGYCGVCRLEKDWVSVCYLSHTSNLTQGLAKMEEQVLFQNARIKEVFQNCDFVYEKPITVSNIHFRKKRLIKDGVFYAGDAAGLITPLSGNGMSMAMQASYILGQLLIKHFQGDISRQQVYSQYQTKWNNAFKFRMATGRTIQKLLRKEKNADRLISAVNAFPFLKKSMISLTHGKPFCSND